jgi:hypothetical protein
MTFARKRIDVSISLANGNFGSGGNSANIKGHRVQAMIENAGGQTMGQLECAIYGLPLTLMNQLTTLGTNVNLTTKNTITLSAGDEGGTISPIYQGTIAVAFADMRAMPQACLRVSAFAGLLPAVKPVEPTSAPGSQDVSKLMGQIAKKAGLTLEDGGVSVKVMNPYLPGAARQQALALAKAAGVDFTIDQDKLVIVPPNKTRQGNSPTISAETGMVGYPAYRQGGIEVTTLFDPNLRLFGQCEVKSDLKPACGNWKIIRIDYDLESETPKGKWFCTLGLTSIDGGGPA